MVLGMRNVKLTRKFLTDDSEGYLAKYDAVEEERQKRLKEKFAPYLSRTIIATNRSQDGRVAYINGYNLADTCTTNDMEVAAALWGHAGTPVSRRTRTTTMSMMSSTS